MRTEKQMYDLIIGIAEKDERIRAVVLNGSRANPEVRRDIFQDFDIVYMVTETASFLADRHWTELFGEPLIIQEPDLMDSYNGAGADFSRGYGYLMQFADGNRIDLHIEIAEDFISGILGDRLSVVLLDKDGVLPKLPEPSAEAYYVKRPTAEQFYAACNEFFWISHYITKELWREEMMFALEHFNLHWRSELIKMLS